MTDRRRRIRLFVDADGCPVVSAAIGVARGRRVPAVLVGNDTQNLRRLAGRDGVEVIEVGQGRDAADFRIITEAEEGDVVVTGDTGLAAMGLGKGLRVLDFRGRRFDLATIDMRLEVRHVERKLRRGGAKTKGPSGFQDEDRERFVAALKRLLDEARGGS
ncbi:MAG: YaiI/YqxD family protein [Actinobacteria bacterium]|nr:MAG: YaiI/YqxD family protein [Actinomycetota bacterium]